MRWVEIDPLLRSRFQPPINYTTARKDESVHAVVVNHREFKVTIRRRCRDRLPLIFVA